MSLQLPPPRRQRRPGQMILAGMIAAAMYFTFRVLEGL